MKLSLLLALACARAFAANVELPKALEAPVFPTTPAIAPSVSAAIPSFSANAPTIVLAPAEISKIAASARANISASASAKEEPLARAAQSIQAASKVPDAAWAARFDGARSPAEDAVVYRTWQLAQSSKSQRARFGALVVDKEGRIIGEGWNRTSTKAERRLIGVGFIIHAEQVAIAQAAMKAKGPLEGARLYVVGISKDAALFAQKLEPTIACQICARTLEKFRVSVMSSSRRGFRELGWDKALAAAKATAKTAGKWWQASYKGKAENPNIVWRPIAEVENRLAGAAVETGNAKLYRVIKDGKEFLSPVPGKYAGWKTGKIFGRLDCESGRRLMKKENRVFFLTYADAIKAGYRPCKKCHPRP